MIYMINWIIIAICKHIIASESLPSACIRIRIDKPANSSVIIAALQIIEFCVRVVVIPAIAQRIDLRHAAKCQLDLAVGVVAVSGDCRSAAVDQVRYIALEVGDVVVGFRRGRTVGAGQGIGRSLGVIGEVQDVLTAIDVVFVGDIGTIAIFHLFQHAVLAEVGVATQYHTGTPACRNSTTGEMGKQVWLRSGKINILPERVNRCNTLNYL